MQLLRSILVLLLASGLAACSGAPLPLSSTPALPPMPVRISTAPSVTPQPPAPAQSPSAGVPGVLACPAGPNTAEACLDDGTIRLVGYLRPPAAVGSAAFSLQRGSQRVAVDVVPAQGHPAAGLAQLCDQNVLAAVEGKIVSLQPPTLAVIREQPAARPTSPAPALTEAFTSTQPGIAFSYPAGWIVRDNTTQIGGLISIENYYLGDLSPTQVPDPSFYKIEFVPIRGSQAATLAQMRQQITGQVLRERQITVDGLPAIRFSLEVTPGGKTEILIVEARGQVWLVQTFQDAAFLDRVIETLRLRPA